MPEYVVVHGYQRYNQEEAIDVAKKEVAKGKPDMLVCEVIKVVRSQVVVEDAPKRPPYKKRGKKAVERLPGTVVSRQKRPNLELGDGDADLSLQIVSFAAPVKDPDGVYRAVLLTNRGNPVGKGNTPIEAIEDALVQVGIVIPSDLEQVPDSEGKRQLLESWK